MRPRCLVFSRQMLGALLLLLAAVGCEESAIGVHRGVGVVQDGDAGPNAGNGGTGSHVDDKAPCDQAPDGTPCGEGKHCLFGDCVGNACGDGIVAGKEECDDGNEQNGDGCNAVCRIGDDSCGNGKVEDGEECDDGNVASGDGCLTTCKIEMSAPPPMDPMDPMDDEPAECGNKKVETGEDCDDGNNADTDACTNACKDAACGDGLVETGMEECDDDNMVDTDACTNACEDAACGDGIVQAGVEQCDDMNMVDTDACTNACEDAVCGDGVIEAGMEVCDDMNMTDCDGCKGDCSRADDVCSDGIIECGEECDDSNMTATDACTDLCLDAECGDSIERAGVEECDDGNADELACTNLCFDPASLCGNGAMDVGETCDDSNRTSCDGCNALCTRADDTCGDSITECGEECDDGTSGMIPADTCQACMTVDPCENCAMTAGNCFGVVAYTRWTACFEDTVDQMGNSGMLCAAVIQCIQDQTTNPPVGRPQGSCVDVASGDIQNCYCGYTTDDGSTPKDSGACAASGPGFDAPCVPEVQAAAGDGVTPQTSPLTISSVFVNPAFAIGDANRFTRCIASSTSVDCMQVCGLKP